MNLHRFAVAFAALLALTAAAPVQGLHVPTDDDAGSGQDAPNRDELALDAPEGTWTGTLHDVHPSGLAIDNEDTYRLDPPPRTRIEVRVEGPVVQSTVEGPGAADSAWGSFPHELSVVRPHGRPVNLTVALPLFADEHTGPAGTGHAYEVTVGFDRFDRFARLHADASSAAWSIEVSGDGPARLAFQPSRSHPSLPAATDEEENTRVTALLHEAPSRACHEDVFFAGSSGPYAPPQVWVQGPVDASASSPALERVHQRVQEAAGSAVVNPTLEIPFASGPAAVRIGLADSDGVGQAGWVVWDDPADVTVKRKDSRARFLTIDDFEGAGPGFRAGPSSYAGNVSARLHVPDNATNTNVFRFNVDSVNEWPVPPNDTPAPNVTHHDHIDVERPDRPMVHLREFEQPNSVHTRTPWNSHDDNPPGTWRIHARHASRMTHADVHRVAFASFGFPPTCPGSGS